MKRCVIEINDSGIELADEDGIRRTSPGYAFCAGREILVGEQAAARLRLNPRAGHDRFWSRLDQKPLPSASGPAHSHADLAWYHLRELWTPVHREYDQVLFAVGDDDPERLALLLAIARSLDVPLKAMAASAVVAAAHSAAHAGPADDYLVLDIHLHEMTAEHVRIAGGHAELGERRRLAQHGTARLNERWAQMIGEAFLKHTRFDPLHSAASEQQLFDRLPTWLGQLAEQPRLRVALTSGGHEFAVDLDREMFTSIAAPLYRPLLDAANEAGAPVLLRHRLGLLPGFRDRLGSSASGTLLAAHAVAIGLLSYHLDTEAENIEEVPYHTRLPLAGGSLASPPATAAPPPAATHLSDGASLWRLSSEPFPLPPGRPPASGAAELRLNGDRLRLIAGDATPVSVNGSPLHGACDVKSGDTLTVGGQNYMLLHQCDE